MGNAIFLMLPSPSHYHAVIPFAKNLAAEGNTVTFVGAPFVEQTIVKEGFGIETWEYTIVYQVRLIKVALSVWLKAGLDKDYLDSFKQEFLENIENLRSLITRLNPDTLYIDEHLADYYLFLMDMGINVNIVCTKISTRRASNIPPMDSYFVPKKNSIFSRAKTAWLWKWHYFKKNKEDVRNKLIFHNQDEYTLQREFLNQKSLRVESLLDKENYFYTGVNGINRIILGSQAFDFPWREKKENESFVFLPVERNESKYLSEKYLNLKKSFHKNSKFLIYFSFGTVSYRNLQRVQVLLDKILRIVAKREDIQLIVSLSNLPFSYDDTHNCFFFEYIPQLDLLNHCDLMITHGGHNSIKECIQKQVKMLVFPHKTDHDQPGNAARVQYHKIGLMGKITKDSQRMIENKIDSLLRMKDVDFSRFKITTPDVDSVVSVNI